MNKQKFTIKPLEWKEKPYGSPIADTLVGRYAIVDNGSSEFIVICYSLKYGNSYTITYASESSDFPTLDDAKAAAEADWQEKLKSVLEPVL